MAESTEGSQQRRYAAMLLFQFRVVKAGVSNKRRLCEKRLILINAANGRAALRAAKRRGRQAQYQYFNDAGSPVHFEFVGVLDLLHLGPECESDEVWYDLVRLIEPMERQAKLVPQESQLQGVAADR